jgi:uncharacterized RDD family membrane protein YckC
MGEATSIRRFYARATDSTGVWIAALAIPLMLVAPALWNGYPLLQYDTGGYLYRDLMIAMARAWYGSQPSWC